MNDEYVVKVKGKIIASAFGAESANLIGDALNAYKPKKRKKKK